MTESKKCQFIHTPSPVGYLQWHAWAGIMTKTHRQVRCPHCSLFAIWVPKVKRVKEEIAR